VIPRPQEESMRRAPPPPRVRFPPDDGFHASLKRGASAYFEDAGRPRWGGTAMKVKSAAILGWFAVSYALLLALGGTSPLAAVGLTASIALATAGIGFSVMHDANHGAHASSRRANRVWGLALDLVGASSYVWRFKHNVLHHTYTNVDGMDADVDAGPFLRLTRGQRRRRFHRLQHLYAWPLYGVLTLKWWFVDDVLDVVRGRLGTHPFPRPRGRELAALVGGKALFLGWTLVVPLLVFRSAAVVGLFVLGALLLGVVLSTVFQLAHAVPEAELHAGPRDGRMPTGWAEHQVRTTVDFAPSNRLLGWYLGGLNFQVEHHLFPDVCHVHHPALARIVEAACRAHGVPRSSQPTLRGAIAAHLRFLRDLGRPGSRVEAEVERGAASPLATGAA
jgi:linoleoyl-CoA desaturase